MSDTRSSFHAPVPRAGEGNSPDIDNDAPTSQMDRVPDWPESPDAAGTSGQATSSPTPGRTPGSAPGGAPNVPLPPVPPIPHVDAAPDDGWSFWERPKRAPEESAPRPSGHADPYGEPQPPSAPLPKRRKSPTGAAPWTEAPGAAAPPPAYPQPPAGPYADPSAPTGYADPSAPTGYGDPSASRRPPSAHSAGPYADVPAYHNPDPDDPLGAAPTSTFPAIDASSGTPPPADPAFGGGYGAQTPPSAAFSATERPEAPGRSRSPFPAPYASPAHQDAAGAPAALDPAYWPPTPDQGMPGPGTFPTPQAPEAPAAQGSVAQGVAAPYAAQESAEPATRRPTATDAAPSAPPAAPAKRKRDPYLDNVKFILIAFVILGHSLVPTLAAHSARSAYLFIYVFHMPLFVIISGYLSRNFWNSNAKTNKLVDTLLIPYVIVEFMFAVLRYALGQKWSLTIIDPAWLNWYLVALLLWRLSTPVWKRMRYPITLSIIAYLLAGLADLPGDFSIDRFFGLMPFFVIGLMLREEHLEMLNRTWVKVAGGVVLAGGAGVAILISPHVKLAPIYYKNGYDALKMTWWMGMGVRIGLLVAALAMSAAILALVPRRTTWFSDLGTRTLYAYILHGVVVLTAKQMGWLSFPWLYGPLGVLAIASSSFALAIVLCLPETRRLFSWMLEPRLGWLYRVGGRPARKP